MPQHIAVVYRYLNTGQISAYLLNNYNAVDACDRHTTYVTSVQKNSCPVHDGQ